MEISFEKLPFQLFSLELDDYSALKLRTGGDCIDPSASRANHYYNSFDLKTSINPYGDGIFRN